MMIYRHALPLWAQMNSILSKTEIVILAYLPYHHVAIISFFISSHWNGKCILWALVKCIPLKIKGKMYNHMENKKQHLTTQRYI